MECSLNYFIVNNSEYLTSVTASFGCLQKPNRFHSFIKKRKKGGKEIQDTVCDDPPLLVTLLVSIATSSFSSSLHFQVKILRIQSTSSFLSQNMSLMYEIGALSLAVV